MTRKAARPGGADCQMIGVRLLDSLVVRSACIRDGHAVHTCDEPLPSDAQPDQILDTIARAVLVRDSKPRAVGLAIPGQVDSAGRCWRLRNVPGFEGVFMGEELAARLGCSVAIENEATAGAHAEVLYGYGQRYPSFIWIMLQAGVACALVFGGTVHRGAFGFAGELGHIAIDTSADAALCSCGARGCLEAHIGADAIELGFRIRGGSGATLANVIESAERGEQPGTQMLARVGESLGQSLSIVQNLLDLDAAVVCPPEGGQVSFIEAFARRTLSSHTFGAPVAEIPIVESKLGPDAVLVGVAELSR